MSWELEDWCTLYPYIVITLDCHLPKCIRLSRPGRIGSRGWALIGDKCVSNVLRISRVLVA